MMGHLASITGTQRSKIALPRAKRGPFANALGEQQRFNAVLDPEPFLHQALALAVSALGVFLFRRRHTYHAAALTITPQIGRKHAQHTHSIEPVSLGSAGA